MGVNTLVFSLPVTSQAPGEYSLRVRSTPSSCIDIINCTATDTEGNTGEALYKLSSDNVTGKLYDIAHRSVQLLLRISFFLLYHAGIHLY